MSKRPIRRALLSVSDKSGLADFARALAHLGVELISTGGTAKNHEWVTFIVDPEDYAAILSEMAAGGVSAETRRKLAQIAFARTAAYDTAVSAWLADEAAKSADTEPPRRRSFAGTLRQKLRYGENPHQEAAFYATGEKRFGVATAAQLQGKELP